MLKTVNGVKDGKIYPETFHQNIIYAIDDSLFLAFESLDAVQELEEEPEMNPEIIIKTEKNVIKTVKEKQQSTKKKTTIRKRKGD